jgi:RimJ/RimL family protein N-acetyltransferase
MLVFLRTAGKPRLIGGVGLMRAEGALELGYWISPDYWGLGFATEAAEAVVNMARHGLRRQRLTARHFIDNPASANVLRKLGFVRTGTIAPRACLARGQEVMAVEYALTLTEKTADEEAAMRRETLLAA